MQLPEMVVALRWSEQFFLFIIVVNKCVNCLVLFDKTKPPCTSKSARRLNAERRDAGWEEVYGLFYFKVLCFQRENITISFQPLSTQGL